MIDSRLSLTYQRRRREWLLRNPVLSQSCETDMNDTELQMPQRGAEEARISPNFLEMDQIDNITGPFEMDFLDPLKDSTVTSNPDGRMNIGNDISCIAASDNAVDPYLYINEPSFSPVASPSVTLPMWPQFGFVPTPAFARQQSINVAMEVLAAAVHAPKSDGDGIQYPLTPTPELGEEDFMFQHPSPCFVQQDAQRTRTVSEHAPLLPFLPDEHSRSRAFSFDHVCSQEANLMYGSFPANSIQTATGNETGSNTESATTANTPCNNNSTTSETESTPVLESLPSIVKASLQNAPLRTICVDSLDIDGMMAEFISTTARDDQTDKTPPVSPCPQPPMVDLTTEQPNSSKSVPKMERTTSYKRRRDQNNKACRESRKKRKLKLTETELKAKELEEENAGLCQEIEVLEKEVEKVRVLVLKQMSGRPKR